MEPHDARHLPRKGSSFSSPPCGLGHHGPALVLLLQNLLGCMCVCLLPSEGQGVRNGTVIATSRSLRIPVCGASSCHANKHHGHRRLSCSLDLHPSLHMRATKGRGAEGLYRALLRVSRRFLCETVTHYESSRRCGVSFRRETTRRPPPARLLSLSLPLGCTPHKEEERYYSPLPGPAAVVVADPVVAFPETGYKRAVT